MVDQILVTILGIAAAGLTSLSCIPQVKKALLTGATNDLSLKTFLILFVGLSLWVAYGILEADLVIIIANAIGALLVALVLICKLRDLCSGPS